MDEIYACCDLNVDIYDRSTILVFKYDENGNTLILDSFQGRLFKHEDTLEYKIISNKKLIRDVYYKYSKYKIKFITDKCNSNINYKSYLNHISDTQRNVLLYIENLIPSKNMKTNQIIINGNSIASNGKSISIVGNRIIIDGTDMTPDSKDISITINGNIESLSADHCNQINIIGEVTKAKTVSGDIDIKGGVLGDVSSVSGDIKCGAVTGSVKTVSGDIKNKK